MYDLTKEEKLDFIISKSKELGVTSYDYGKNTELSDLGARNILNGISKNPRTKNLNIMLKYLESEVLASNVGKVQEPIEDYKTLEDILFERLEKRFKKRFKKIDKEMNNIREDMRRMLEKDINQDQNQPRKSRSSS